MDLTRRQLLGAGVAGLAGLALAACGSRTGAAGDGMGSLRNGSSGAGAAGGDPSATGAAGRAADAAGLGTFERGTQTDCGFEVDDLLRGTPAGDIHFSLHVPDSYDGSKPFGLYIHCPGWEGLYFQGVGANLQEDFAFVANDYVADMIVASPQLDDWGDASADKTVALTRWLLANYNVDPAHVWLSGYSGGGETVSLVMDKAPGLYRRVLHMSSKWDGSGDALVAARVPLRMSIGRSDEYYGSEPISGTYEDLRQKYAAAGVSDDEIARLLVLDVKPDDYFDSFTGGGSYHEHAGGAALFSHDAEAMGWLFS